MMKVMIAPERLHPLERRIPGMDGIMHAAIKKIAEHKPGKEHKDIVTHNQVLQTKNG